MPERKSNPMRTVLISAFVLALIGGAFWFGRSSTASASITAPTSTAVPTPAPSPTPKIEFGPVVIKQIQSMSRLQTTTYTLEQVVVREKPSWLPWRTQKLLLIVDGKVTAGVDLAKLGVQSIRMSEETKTVHIQLPPAEIFDKFLVDEKTRIYDYDKGFLGSVDPKLIEDTRKQGLDQIVRAACEDGVLDRAAKDAQVAMAQLLLPTGVQVEFEPSLPATCPVLPEPTATAK